MSRKSPLKVVLTNEEGGGFILAPSHNLQLDISIDNILAMYKAKR